MPNGDWCLVSSQPLRNLNANYSLAGPKWPCYCQSERYPPWSPSPQDAQLNGGPDAPVGSSKAKNQLVWSRHNSGTISKSQRGRHAERCEGYAPECLARIPRHLERGIPGPDPKETSNRGGTQGERDRSGGNELVALELGHTDTASTTCLHVPSIGLVVAGDAAYNDVHLYLVELDPQTRREWIAALDKIESLNPRAVVAAHKRPENDDNPRVIEETRQYIRDFDRLGNN
jgi:hypothetical protein